jgi:hypothetical protein
MFCTECGTQIDEGKKFCKNCGARMRSDAAPAAARPGPARTSPGIDKSILIAAGIALVVILGGAGVFFGTDLLRPSGRQDEAPGRSAATVGSPPPMRESPGQSAATVGASPPMEEYPGRSAATAGSSAPESERPGRSAATRGQRPYPPPASATRPPAPAVASRRTPDAGIYETVRATTVFEQPSASSRSVASIPQGIRVNVVSSTGSWLEVHSKSGKPPGFIRRGDAVFVERPG